MTDAGGSATGSAIVLSESQLPGDQVQVLTVPLIAGYAYHKGAWKNREARRWTRLLEPAAVA